MRLPRIFRRSRVDEPEHGYLPVPVNPHPDRGCDQTCDLTDGAHEGVYFYPPGLR